MKSIIHWLLFLVIAAGVTSVQAARLYKWVDEDGRVSYHDRPPPEGSAYKVERKEFKSRASNRNSSDSPSGAADSKPVTLYSVDRCASCDMTREYLQKKRIPFTEKSVLDNVSVMEELVALTGGKEVPVVKIGDRFVTGFAVRWLETELAAAGYLKKQESGEP